MNIAKKGYRGEVEVKDMLLDLGFDAERSWGSDGRALVLLVILILKQSVMT